MEPDVFRIPISLKVEKDEMFYNFIKPARDDRSLTKIITNLLRAYYEDDEIRRLVDARNAGEEILQMLNEQIDRIAMEHSKSIAQVAALRYETENVYHTETPSSTMEDIMSMLTTLTTRVNKLERSQVPVDEIIIPDFDKELSITPSPLVVSAVEEETETEDAPTPTEMLSDGVSAVNGEVIGVHHKTAKKANSLGLSKNKIVPTAEAPKVVPPSFAKLSSSLTKTSG